MEVSNKDLFRKLEEIQAILVDLKEEEDEIMHEEHEIEMAEQELHELLGKAINRQFEDITEWKKQVWDGCELKASKVKDDKIDFACKKTGNNCRFVDCPKNRTD